MDARCPSCGWEGEPEELVGGFAVCGECARPLALASEALFDARRFRFARPLMRGIPRALMSEDGRELARVHRARLRPRVLLAHLGGALVAAAIMMAALLAGEIWPTLGFWPLYLIGPLGLNLGLIVSARLSPGPQLLLVRSGRDPRLLLQVRPTGAHGARCTLEVEDANGTAIGEIDLDRLRAKPSAFGPLEDFLRVRTPDGTELSARRLFRLRPGAVLETNAGDAVATIGLTGGMSWDELAIGDSTIDPRLVVAAALVAAP